MDFHSLWRTNRKWNRDAVETSSSAISCRRPPFAGEMTTKTMRLPRRQPRRRPNRSGTASPACPPSWRKFFAWTRSVVRTPGRQTTFPRVRTWYYYAVDAVLMYYYDWQTGDVDVSLQFCEHFALRSHYVWHYTITIHRQHLHGHDS